MRLGNYEISDLPAWLRSRRNRWEGLRIAYECGRKTCPVEVLVELLNDCEALADALEESSK